jgi:hypothetical protein
MAAIKKTILLALAVLVMAGCEERQSKSVDGVDVVTIDSCEYIRSCTYMGYCVYSHKANCRFCKERRQKELKELVEQLKEK